MKDKKRSIGFTFAINGLIEVMKSERNFRLHLLSVMFVSIAGLYFNINVVEWIAVVIVIGIVITAEIFNTAIELMIDYLKPEIHPAAKIIKDVAAAAVFIASITAFIVGLIIFIPKFLS